MLLRERRSVRRIKDLPAESRPRERMAAKGAGTLSDADLVAILLGTGDGARSASRLAEALLARFSDGSGSSLRGLSHASGAELSSELGMGPAKSARLLAAFELGRRVSALGVGERAVVSAPADAYRLLAPRLAGLDREHFVAVLLNTKHQVLGIEPVSIGTLDSTLVHPRELFREAVRRSAAAVLLAHNHPSGDPTPSPEDHALTAQVMAAGAILGIRIVDHLVLGEGRFVSLRETSELWRDAPFHS